MSDGTRDRYLKARWNNILTLSLGLPALAFAIVAVATDAFADRAAFIGLVVVSSFY